MNRFIFNIAIALTIISILLEVTSATTACKIIVMDILMKRCLLEGRIKRGVEKFDLDKSDYQRPKTKIGIPVAKDSEPQKTVHKRYLSEENLGTIERPFLAEFDSFSEQYIEQSKYVLPYPIFEPDPFRTLEDSEDLLDFELTNQELDELYTVMADRIPRSSKEEAKKIFMHTAAKCCQNIDVCAKSAKNIPCIGFDSVS